MESQVAVRNGRTKTYRTESATRESEFKDLAKKCGARGSHLFRAVAKSTRFRAQNVVLNNHLLPCRVLLPSRFCW